MAEREGAPLGHSDGSRLGGAARGGGTGDQLGGGRGSSGGPRHAPPLPMGTGDRGGRTGAGGEAGEAVERKRRIELVDGSTVMMKDCPREGPIVEDADDPGEKSKPEALAPWLEKPAQPLPWDGIMRASKSQDREPAPTESVHFEPEDESSDSSSSEKNVFDPRAVHARHGRKQLPMKSTGRPPFGGARTATCRHDCECRSVVRGTAPSDGGMQ